MLDRPVFSKLCERGWVTVPMPPSVMQAAAIAMEDWRAFFTSPTKFSVGGDVRMPRGYLPFCQRGGCEMKESFYVQPGYPLPSAPKRSSLALISALRRMAEDIAIELSRETGEAIVRTPRFGCLRMMRYPALEGEEESPLMRELAKSGAQRAPPHRDESAVTLLPSATQPGLEIRREDGGWQVRDTERGAMTIMLGKEAVARAPDRLTAAEHRVAVPEHSEGISRIACAYFAG